MFAIFKMEFANCIKRNEFRLIFLILLIMNLYSFINTSIIVRGMNLSALRSGFEMSILIHPYGQSVLMTILFVLPLLSSVIYSDSYITDVKSGTYTFLVTRTNKNTYIISKAMIVVISTFITFSIPMLVSLFWSIVTFPCINYETNGLPPYFIEYIPEEFFNWLRIGNPFLFCLFSIVKISFFACIYALLSYAFSLIFMKNRLIPIALTMFSFLVFDIFISLSPYGFRYQIVNLPLPTTSSSGLYMMIMILILISISLILMVIKFNKNEII